MHVHAGSAAASGSVAGVLGRSRLAGNALGGARGGGASGQRARSDYEERQIMLLLQAVERMKEMVQVGFTFLGGKPPHSPLSACTPWLPSRL